MPCISARGILGYPKIVSIQVKLLNNYKIFIFTIGQTNWHKTSCTIGIRDAASVLYNSTKNKTAKNVFQKRQSSILTNILNAKKSVCRGQFSLDCKRSRAQITVKILSLNW